MGDVVFRNVTFAYFSPYTNCATRQHFTKVTTPRLSQQNL
jgi:hypothetical protein